MRRFNKDAKKKAFTLVELLVVIAILAILAGVSVVGYLGFTAKANLSNDQQMIKMINDNLLATSIERKPEKPSDAISDLFTIGFNNEKLEPFSNNFHYAYSLENNKMYLLDDNDAVIFPEEDVSVSSLWGFYRNQDIDRIDPVTKYIAMETVGKGTAFDAVFSGTSTEYKIDLNNNIILANSKDNITVSNGHILPDATFKTEGEAVSKKTAVNASSNFTNVSENSDKELLVKDIFINHTDETIAKNFRKKLASLAAGKEEVIIDGCVFDGANNGTNYIADLETTMPYKLIYRNCTWMNFKSWTMKVCGGHNQFEFDHCHLINCVRGINLNPAESTVVKNKELKAGSSIHDCEFILFNERKSKAIQIAAYYASTQYDLDIINATKPLWNIYNNEFKSGAAAITLHECFVRPTKSFTDAGYEPSRLTQSQFEKAFKFSGNKTTDKVGKGSKDVLDGASDVKFNEEENTYLDGLITYIDSNF